MTQMTKLRIYQWPSVLLSLSFGVLLFAYWGTILSFTKVWSDENNPGYSHGYLLFLVSVYFVWIAWVKNKNTIHLQPNGLAIFATGAMSSIWFLANLGNIQIIQQLAIIFLVLLLFVSLLGFQQAKLFVYPVLILVFAVPVWDFLNIYLRQFATDATGALLDLSRITNYVEGFMIFVPNGTFLVNPGCAGLGQLVIALTIAFIYTYVNPSPWLYRVALFVAAAIVAIAANIARVYIIVVMGYLSDMKNYLVTVEHVSLGWVLFAIAMGLYLYMANRLMDTLDPKHFNKEPDDPRADNRPVDWAAYAGTKSTILFASLFLMIVSGPLLSQSFGKVRIDPKSDMHQLPDSVVNWKAQVPISGSYGWEPKYAGADIQQKDVYIQNNMIVKVYAYRYVNQAQGKEAVNDLNIVYRPPEWSLLTRSKKSVDIAGKSYVIDESIIQSRRGRKLLVWRWYSVMHHITGNALMAKLMNIWGILNRRPSITAYVVATEAGESPRDSEYALQEFYKDFVMSRAIDGNKNTS